MFVVQQANNHHAERAKENNRQLKASLLEAMVQTFDCIRIDERKLTRAQREKCEQADQSWQCQRGDHRQTAGEWNRLVMNLSVSGVVHKA